MQEMDCKRISERIIGETIEYEFLKRKKQSKKTKKNLDKIMIKFLNECNH